MLLNYFIDSITIIFFVLNINLWKDVTFVILKKNENWLNSLIIFDLNYLPLYNIEHLIYYNLKNDSYTCPHWGYHNEKIINAK